MTRKSLVGYKAKIVNSCQDVVLKPGESKEVWVEFKNIGQKTWTTNTYLGTEGRRDRSSLFVTPTWINPARPTNFKRDVLPGTSARIYFMIQAPLTAVGTFVERFALVQEGVTWFDKTTESIWSLEIKIDSTVRLSVDKKKELSNSNDCKILYLSCHETLEHSEMTLFSQLGLNVFPVGFYSTPTPINPTRSTVNFKIDPELQDKFMRLVYNKNFKPGAPIRLHNEFVKNFDIIINCHWSENFDYNRHFFRNKEIIWRSIGLSNSGLEQKILAYKKQLAMHIVRMTPVEPTTAGVSAVIRSHIDPDYYNGWIGNEEYVLTIQKWTRLGEKGRLANEYQAVTNGLQRKLCGKENKGFDCMVDNPTDDELLEFRRKARVYFSLATQNASATYTFFEAMMTGMPVVSVGSKLARTPWFENPKFIQNGVSGFVSDDLKELRRYIELVLKDYDLACKLGMNARQSVINVFHPNIILNDWRTFFANNYGLNL